jgi:hypothetical protein
MSPDALAALIGALASAVVLESVRALIRRSHDRETRRSTEAIERRRISSERLRDDRLHITQLERERDYWRQRYNDLVEERIRSALPAPPPSAPSP